MLRDVCILLTCAIASVASRNSYLFIAPNTIRPGRTLTLEGSLLEKPNGPVTLTATVKKAGVEVASTQALAFDTNNVILDIPVPHDLKPGIYDLSIKGRGGGASFDKTVTLEYKEKGLSVFIQTDKAVYKPGQTIHFRVFATDPDLRVIIDKLHVDLFDPKGTKMNQWARSNLQMTEVGGVAVEKQLMSDHPEFGTWKLVATIRGITEEQQFEVDEYVLPKFEVTLDLPPFGRAKDSSFEGKVIAKYTFGKPVKGTVDLSIRSKKERFVWRNNQRESTNKEVNLNFPIHGEAKFNVDMKKLKDLERSLNGETLVFDANVTESLTRFKIRDTEEVKFYNNPIKVEFPKSLPDTFKPGMDYTGVVKVSLVDGSPLDAVIGKLKLTVTETTEILQPWEPEPVPFWRRWRPWQSWRPWRPRPPRPVETTRDRSPQYLTIPADGLVEFSVSTTDAVKKLSLKAEYSESSATKELKKRHSPSDNFLQVTLPSEKLQAGTTVDLTIKTTESPGEVNYQIHSRGTIADFGTLTTTGRRTTWSLPLTQDMTPRSTIVVYYVRADGEVVADSITVSIQGVFKNKVQIGFNASQAQPGNTVEMRVVAKAGSRVSLLAVDKSVLLMGTGNDISKDKVLEELQSYNNKGKRSNIDVPVCGWLCWRYPLPAGGKDVKDVFDEAGVLVLTDALIYEYREPLPPPPVFEPEPWFAARPVFALDGGMGGGGLFRNAARGAAGMADVAMAAPRLAMASESIMAGPGPVPTVDMKPIISKDNLAPVKRTRKLFPETWLWKSTDIDHTGYTHLTETVPDTITSWVATAFAIHPEAGLGLTESPAQLEVAKKFFVIVQLPYSVTRGEQVVIQANVFNYGPEEVYAYVVLSQSGDFDNLIIDGLTTRTESKDVTRSVNVQPGGVESVYFPIIPKTLGKVKVNIRAQTGTESDAIKKELLVEAEGTPREYNLPVMIDLKTPGTFTKTVTVEYPVRVVPGSERVQVTVIGDLMGPSIKGLDSLLKMPYGCGEQNMLNFAPNIFIVKYLETTNNIDSATIEKAKNFMEKGYQRELNYRHEDGSFSAFGKRDDSGSIWLTAFVLKSFVEAKPYIFIDDNIVNKMAEWILKYQNKNGSFWEPGRVIHKAMQGGSTSGEVSLTAYVLISLLEARKIEGVASKIESAKNNAQKFLEGQLSSTTDPYDLAIMSYALQLAGSAEAGTAWNKLNQLAQTSGGLKWWQREAASTTDQKPWKKRSGQAINIEMTAYALLTLAAKGDFVEGLPVLKWITEQRNPNGGFSSTQDTVIALQSLSNMASQIHSSNVDQAINIVGNGYQGTFTVNSVNARVLQIQPVPANVGAVTITANGHGFSLVQVEVNYNIDDDDQKRSFLLTTTLPRETMNDYDVRVCTSWTEPGSSSMAVLEIGSPSGFIADEASVASSTQKPKRVEVEHKKLTLYYDEIGREDTCVTVTMHRIGLVASAQPVPVHVFDYYEPTKQATEFYVPVVLQESTVCDVCEADCDFCSKKTL